LEQEQQRLRATWVRPADVSDPALLEDLGGALSRECTLEDLLRRPQVAYRNIMNLPGVGPGVEDTKVAEQIEIQAKYSGYIERQQEEIARSRRYENTPLPMDIDYAQVHGLSVEATQKLRATRPATIGQASRIPGVTPAAVSILLVHLKKRRTMKQQIA